MIHSKCDSDYGLIGQFLMSPRAHYVHHSANPDHHDKNFSIHFTVWDQIFGTYLAPTSEKIVMGLSTEGEPAQAFYPAALVQTLRLSSRTFFRRFVWRSLNLDTHDLNREREPRAIQKI